MSENEKNFKNLKEKMSKFSLVLNPLAGTGALGLVDNKCIYKTWENSVTYFGFGSYKIHTVVNSF